MWCYKICILLFLIKLVTSTNTCVSQNPCECIFDTGEVIDLTTVGTPNFPRFFELAPSNVSHLGRYSYNPCYPFTLSKDHVSLKPQNKACSNAAGCKRSPGTSDGVMPEEHAIGIQSTATFGNNSDLGMHINYSVPNAAQNLTVILTCADDTSHRLIIETPETLSNENIVMNFISKCACRNGCRAEPPSPPSGLSTGSQLLIAFFTIVIAYLIFGMLWKFCNGAQGMEIIPNIEFWNDFPKLVVEGVIFSCSCFGRQSSYGEV